MAIGLIILILVLMLVKPGVQEYLMIPGVVNRTETEASFLDDRSNFEKNEVDFYNRYKT